MVKKKEKSLKSTGITLSDYVEQVCVEVLIGVTKAQSHEDLGKYIGATSRNETNDDTIGNFVTKIVFDVFAEVNSNATGEGRLGITVAGAKGEVSRAHSSSNRISFEIPVAIPKPDGAVKRRLGTLAIGLG